MFLLDGGILPHQRRGRLGHCRAASCADYNKAAATLHVRDAKSQLTVLPPDVFLTRMELRKDPITRSWVITGDDVPDATAARRVALPLLRQCDSPLQRQLISNMAANRRAVRGRRAQWFIPPRCIASKASPRVAAMACTIACVRWAPMKCWWRIRGTTGKLWNASDAEIEQFLRLAAQRIQDLKRDARFKYVSIFKNLGVNAGQEFEHPTFAADGHHLRPAPRALRTARRPGLLSSERTLRLLRHYRPGGTPETSVWSKCGATIIALCPYAPRVPYETWIIPRTHEASFERFGAGPAGQPCAIWERFCAALCSGSVP